MLGPVLSAHVVIFNSILTFNEINSLNRMNLIVCSATDVLYSFKKLWFKC